MIMKVTDLKTLKINGVECEVFDKLPENASGEYLRDNIFVWDNGGESQVKSLIDNILHKVNRKKVKLNNPKKLENGLFLMFCSNPAFADAVEKMLSDNERCNIGEVIPSFKYGYSTFNVHEGNYENTLIINNEVILINANLSNRDKLEFLFECIFNITNAFMHLEIDADDLKYLSESFFKVVEDNKKLISALCSVSILEPKEGHIKLGHKQIKFFEGEHLISFNEREKRHEMINGICRHNDKEIELETNMSKRTKLEVTIHEILHAAIRYMDIDYKKFDTTKDVEEEHVIQLANALTMIVLDNPQLVSKIDKYSQSERKTDDEIHKLLENIRLKTLKFNELELGKLEERLKESEKELAEFKNRN